MEEQKKEYNFKNFKLRISNRSPLNERVYTSRWNYYRTYDPVAEDFTLEQINKIIRSGEIEQLRELSRFFYRTNSRYRNNVDFLARLPLYDTVIIPVYQEGKGSKAQITKAFYNACNFVDKLDVPNTFMRITTEWIKNGIYYGILRIDGENVSIQDLPIAYCRTRFKDFNNLNILEFNLQYFERITDKEQREEIISTFPKVVQKNWIAWNSNKNKGDPWIMLSAEDGGVCFSFSADQTPLLIASIPELKKLDEATNREEKRDENELYKLLIQKMPIDDKGELVFPLEEVANMHEAIGVMLQDIDTVDVLTTFGDTSLESLQENSAASQSADRIGKYKRNAWEALGRGEILFNPDGSSALAYMIKKDETLMIGFLNMYETWIKFHINDKFARKGLSFDFEILPTTVFNRNDIQKTYFSGAQYGYSKMFAGVVMGIKQMSQLSLMNFENDFLQMSIKMIPLQSSYTSSGNENQKNNSSEQKVNNRQTNRDITNTGGRPELPDEQKSEKTQANIASAG